MFRRILLIALSVVIAAAMVRAARAQTVRDIAFPVNGTVTFRDDYGEPRWGGRIHEGVDLIGQKMMPLVSAINGRVSYIVNPEDFWGFAVVLEDFEGWSYHYLHVNNDTPGTDDGLGGSENAYAPGIYQGAQVVRGQHVAWMGDSGNAENAGPHLHFEMRMPDGTPVNPYQSLLNAAQVNRYDADAETAASPTINDDKRLVADPARPMFCLGGSLIKSVSSKAVYYCGADGRRYVFPNQRIYATWYADFSGVLTLTDAELAAVPLGKNVTYRPGVRLVKITTDPKVYAVSRGGVLRWITTTELAVALYGSDWPKKIDDLSDAFFVDYAVGQPITAP